jgi:hypothetical protein
VWVCAGNGWGCAGVCLLVYPRGRACISNAHAHIKVRGGRGAVSSSLGHPLLERTGAVVFSLSLSLSLMLHLCVRARCVCGVMLHKCHV